MRRARSLCRSLMEVIRLQLMGYGLQVTGYSLRVMACSKR